MTSIDTVHGIIECGSLAKARKLALAAARAGSLNSEHTVRNSGIVYVVCCDGIHLLTKSDDGRTISDRIIPN